jgi:GT2 family glycosyltransferase
MKVRGKFLFDKDEKFYIKGVTYGTFKPDNNNFQFPDIQRIEQDFKMMSQCGINSVRTYTTPSLELLDIAAKNDLKVMAGLPWEQHIAFLDDPLRKKDIFGRVREDVRKLKSHPALLCWTIGNEIPAPIVRYYGKSKIEDFLEDLYITVKDVDPDCLATYVNYPTTEYLNLDFLDFDCFNVYLETPEKLGSYINRLHNLNGDRPLVLAEIGLDSYRNGHQKQSETLSWQIKTTFEKGCAGLYVFAWTDEWWRGGFEIEDWHFGIVDRERQPKPALFSVAQAFTNTPVQDVNKFPSISVVVCTYNGSATIRKCLDGIMKIDYPEYEVIVVNDGSTDNIESIIKEYPVSLITTSNKGLSSARNTGMENAKGEIIAYIDDDASPDIHWLKYLAYAYMNTDHSCIGGPNIAPPDEGFVPTCVANAPGGPVHVLLTDEIAEHVPGCNMSFRKEALKKIGGFDPVFVSAGDDVDACWRIMENGMTIGFHPAAVVWHYRRNSLKAYWKQQKGYGKAEALLEAKWPEKYNALGHLTWAGRIYGNGLTVPLKVKKDKIYHGVWGTALFQSVYQPSDSFLNSIPLMPEWYFLSAIFAVFGLLGFVWAPLFIFWVLLIISLFIVVIQSAISSAKSSSLSFEKKHDLRYRLLITFLHIIQPIARLYGRLKHGLTPWRIRGAGLSSKFLLVFGYRVFTHWSEEWHSADSWLSVIEKNLIKLKSRVGRGSEFDRWDIQVKIGFFSKSRGLLTIEEHGGGKQFLRFKCWANYSPYGFIISGIFSLLGLIAVINDNWFVAFPFFLLILVMLFRFILETGSSMNSLYTAFNSLNEIPEKQIEEVSSAGLDTKHHFYNDNTEQHFNKTFAKV